MLRKRESRAILILGSLFGLVLFSGNRISQNHELSSSLLKSKTPYCASRGISSVSSNDSESESLQQLCQNQRKIESLRSDIEKLETEKERVLNALEKAVEKVENKEASEEKARLQLALMSRYQYPYWKLNALQRQYDQTPAFMNVYSPFHDHSTAKNMQYLKVAMEQRLAMRLQSAQSWSPEWNSKGHLTNPIYGNSQTWQQLEDMHRLPVSTGYGGFPSTTPFNQSFSLY